MFDCMFLSPFPFFSVFLLEIGKNTPIPSTVIFFVETGVVRNKGETSIAKLQGNRKKLTRFQEDRAN